MSVSRVTSFCPLFILGPRHITLILGYLSGSLALCYGLVAPHAVHTSELIGAPADPSAESRVFHGLSTG